MAAAMQQARGESAAQAQERDNRLSVMSQDLSGFEDVAFGAFESRRPSTAEVSARSSFHVTTNNPLANGASHQGGGDGGNGFFMSVEKGAHPNTNLAANGGESNAATNKSPDDAEQDSETVTRRRGLTTSAGGEVDPKTVLEDSKRALTQANLRDLEIATAQRNAVPLHHAAVSDEDVQLGAVELRMSVWSAFHMWMYRTYCAPTKMVSHGLHGAEGWKGATVLVARALVVFLINVATLVGLIGYQRSISERNEVTMQQFEEQKAWGGETNFITWYCTSEDGIHSFEDWCARPDTRYVVKYVCMSVLMLHIIGREGANSLYISVHSDSVASATRLPLWKEWLCMRLPAVWQSFYAISLVFFTTIVLDDQKNILDMFEYVLVLTFLSEVDEQILRAHADFAGLYTNGELITHIPRYMHRWTDTTLTAVQLSFILLIVGVRCPIALLDPHLGVRDAQRITGFLSDLLLFLDKAATLGSMLLPFAVMCYIFWGAQCMMLIAQPLRRVWAPIALAIGVDSPDDESESRATHATGTTALREGSTTQISAIVIGSLMLAFVLEILAFFSYRFACPSGSMCRYN